MIKSVGVFLLISACCGLGYGQATKSTASADADALKQLERGWSEAQKSVDIDKLNQIIADDWAGIGSDGSRETKRQLLADVKSGANKLESFEIGPMDVKMLGNIAVVQGSDTEKSSNKGKDTSGKWAWTDVFVKRGGKWQAVRSQSAKVQ